jgi:hypothetical protein
VISSIPASTNSMNVTYNESGIESKHFEAKEIIVDNPEVIKDSNLKWKKP